MMDRRADRVAHAGDRSEGVRPRPQVGDFAQEFEAVPLFLQRIGLRVGRAEDIERPGRQLDALPLPGLSLSSPATWRLAPVVISLMCDS